MDAKWDLKLSKAMFTNKWVPSHDLKLGLKIARLYKRNVSGRVTLQPYSKLWPVSFNKTSTKRRSIFTEMFKVRTKSLQSAF